jgi:hypothetical protein
MARRGPRDVVMRGPYAANGQHPPYEHFLQMIQRAIDAGVPFAWVTADEAYGQVKPMPVT